VRRRILSASQGLGPKIAVEIGAREGSIMRVTEREAKQKWCPFVRIEGDNRIHNMLTDGFDKEHLFHHCIGSTCMAWRVFSYSHMKGGDPVDHHGYCGLAGKPETGE
jgi:hypothetical protein